LLLFICVKQKLFVWKLGGRLLSSQSELSKKLWLAGKKPALQIRFRLRRQVMWPWCYLTKKSPDNWLYVKALVWILLRVISVYGLVSCLY